MPTCGWRWLSVTTFIMGLAQLGLKISENEKLSFVGLLKWPFYGI
jgi:hypothetical protein